MIFFSYSGGILPIQPLWLNGISTYTTSKYSLTDSTINYRKSSIGPSLSENIERAEVATKIKIVQKYLANPTSEYSANF